MPNLNPKTVSEAAELAQALMQSDPENFKQGYTRENAVIAASEVSGFSREDVDSALQSLLHTCDACGSTVRVVYDTDASGPFDLICDECGWTFYVPAEAKSRSRIEKVREIVREHSAKRIEGYIVDAFTANMLLTIYNALSPSSREKFGQPEFSKLVDFGWKHVKV